MKETVSFHASVREQGVLVIDDSTVQRQAAIDQLRGLGITQIWGAHDGQAGLDLLEGQGIRPAVVFVDLEMPGMDGIEFLHNLSQLNARPAVAVLSGANPSVLNSVGLMVEALSLPLLDVISKPLTAERLCKALLRVAEVTSDAVVSCSVPVSMELSDFTAALADGRLIPYYQPKVALDTGAVVGFEALARCVTPDDRALPPSSFIELAEQNGLMGLLTISMLKSVLSDLASWHAHSFFPTISLNVSAASLGRLGIGSEIMRLVEAADISPSSITLEITESALVSELAVALGTLGRMRLKGFGLSLDDFGTGFSSFQQLDRLPFTELKIDRSFVSQADRRESRRRILASAIRTGQQLNLITVAEGVETVEELVLLKNLGCNQVQGYLLGKPMPCNNVGSWLSENRELISRMCVG